MKVSFDISVSDKDNSASRKAGNLGQSKRTHAPVIIVIPPEIKNELDAKDTNKNLLSKGSSQGSTETPTINGRASFNSSIVNESASQGSTETPTINGSASFNSSIINDKKGIINNKHKIDDNESHEEKNLSNKKHKSTKNQVADDDTDISTIASYNVFGYAESNTEEKLRKKHNYERLKQNRFDDDSISTLTQSSDASLSIKQTKIKVQQVLLKDIEDNGDKKPKAK